MTFRTKPNSSGNRYAAARGCNIGVSWFEDYSDRMREEQRIQNFQMANRPSSSGQRTDFKKYKLRFGKNKYTGLMSKLEIPDWNQINTPLPDMNYGYKPCDAVEKRQQSELNDFYLENGVTIEGEHVPNPIYTFDEIDFPLPITMVLKEKFQVPTTIQQVAWPIIMSGRNVFGVSCTGSGKTLAFLLPSIVHILCQKKRMPGDGPFVLVIVPTHEIAKQIERELQPFTQILGFRSFVVTPGHYNLNIQEMALKEGVDILIATPGRLIDVLVQGFTTLYRCSYVAIDEADRLLDLGFEPQIRKIFEQLRPTLRQTHMFSATWPEEVQKLAHDFVSDYIFINVGSLRGNISKNLIQIVEMVPDANKDARTLLFLNKIKKEYPKLKCIIFVNTNIRADLVTIFLRKNGWNAVSLHADKPHPERNWAMKEFKSPRAPVIATTDIMGRGLDLKFVSHVLNYDMPEKFNDYIHRIGRAGRGTHTKGTVITFMTTKDAPNAPILVDVMQEHKQEVSPELQELANVGKTYIRNFATGCSESNIRREGARKRGANFAHNEAYNFTYEGGDIKKMLSEESHLKF